MQPTGNPFLDNYAPTGQGQSAAPAAAHHSFLGSLYDATLKPAINTVAGLPSDFAHSVMAAGIGLGSMARGEHGAAAASSKQSALNEIKKAPGFSPFFQSDVASQTAPGQTGKTLEGIGGKTLSDTANVAAFAPGLGVAAKGATTLGKIGTAAKAGAGLGAAQGAAQQMEQGGNFGDVAGGAVKGGATGAVVGGALAGAGAATRGIYGKLSGKGSGTGTVNGDVPVRVAGAEPTGFGAKAATQAGKDKALSVKAENQQEFNGAQRGVNNATAFDTQGRPVSLQEVHDTLHQFNMTPDTNGVPLSENMQQFHDIGTQTIGHHLDQATQGIKADASQAVVAGRKAVMDNVGLLPGDLRRGTGAGASTLRQVRIATNGLGRNSSVSDVLGAISKLEGYQKDVAPGVQNGDPQATGQNNVYKAVSDHLHGLLDSGKVNDAVKNYSIPFKDELGGEDAQTTRHDILGAGGSHELADHMLNTINQGKTYASQRSAMQLPVVAGKLAAAARLHESQAIAQAPSGENAAVRGIAPELAITAAHPAYGPFAASRVIAQKYNALKNGIAKGVNPGAFDSGFQQGMAPNEVTQGKIMANLPDSGGVPPTPPTPPAGGAIPPKEPPTPTMSGRLASAATSPPALNGLRNATAETAGGNVNMPAPAQPVDQSAGGMADQTGGMGAGVDQSQQDQSGTSYSLQAMEGDISRDPRNASTYMDLYKMINPAGSAQSNLTTTQKNTIEGLQSAVGNLVPYAQQLKDAHSPGGILGGVESFLGGVPGVNQITPQNYQDIHSLNSSRVEIATQIAKALTGNKPPASLITQWENTIPSATDTPQVQQVKWQQFSQRLQGGLNAVQQPIGDPSNLNSLLSQLGGSNGQ